MTGFCESFCPFLSKSLLFHFNRLQNDFPILLLNGLVMIANEGSIVCKCFKKGNVRDIHSNIAHFVQNLKERYRIEIISSKIEVNVCTVKQRSISLTFPWKFLSEFLGKGEQHLR